AFKPWLRQAFQEAVQILSQSIGFEGNGTKHHAFTNYALASIQPNCQWNYWRTVIDCANKSLAMKLSAIGHIAKARGLLGQDQHELAFEAFDLAFRDCKADETRFLLLIKAIFMFISGKREYAIARVNDLITVADDSEKYDYLQVLANMHLMQGNTELTMQSFERAQSLSFFRRGFHLVTILLIFGRSFEELDI
ncbi:hypothetical protein EV363DRAFT_1086089, partial [Boletus edulis]